MISRSGLLGIVLLTAAAVQLMAGAVQATNSVDVESKSVLPAATGVTIGVFVDNDIPITAITLPLELRSLSAGAYVTTAFSFGINAAGRMFSSPIGPGGSPSANITNGRFANPDTINCSGPVSNSYLTSSGQIDFVSPDAVLFASVSTGDPGIGDSITLDPGADAPGVPSFRFTFNVTAITGNCGAFEIDTCCVRPANHLAFVDRNTNPVTPSFIKGMIYISDNNNDAPICAPIADTTYFQSTPTQVCRPASATDPNGNLAGCQLVTGPGAVIGGNWCYTPAGHETVNVTIRCTDSCGATCDESFSATFVDTCFANTDINGDGIPFTTSDLVYLIQFVDGGGSAPVPLYRADLNADGFVDYGDVEIFQNYFIYGISIFPEYPVPVTCNPDTVRGACCEGYTCHLRSRANCERQDGLFYGGGTRCSTTTCVGPPGCPANENMIQNEGFVNGAVSGPMPSPGQSLHWGRGYGNPMVVADSGCEDSVYVRLDGNKTTGSAVYQQLSTPIQSGHVYELQLCIRVPPGFPVDYAKLRTVAFNGTLPLAGAHPFKQFSFPPTPSPVAIMDVSGKLPVCGNEWSTYISQRWKAIKSFDNIAINAENNDPIQSSYVDIDNICLHEVNDSIPCYLVQMDTLGNIIYPDSLDPDCAPVVEEDIDLFMGSVSDLYANCGAGSGIDTFYANPGCPDSCASIGGTIPAEILRFNLQDSLSLLGITDSIGQILDSLLTLENLLPGYLDNVLGLLAGGGHFPECDTLPPKGPPPDFPNSPFNGRDIVFIHGFMADALCDSINEVPGAGSTWPTDRDAFYDDGNGGYWKDKAEAYWNEHIKQYLGVDAKGNPSPGRGYRNHFLVVTYPSTQPGIVAAHAILEQITNAVGSGRDVRKCNSSDGRTLDDFGENGFVIISHSEGALLGNVAMKLSEQTGTNSWLGVLLGNVSRIAALCDEHIAIQGDFMGSNYAALALLAVFEPQLAPVAENILNGCDPTNQKWLFTSLLTDMAIPRFIYGGDLFDSLCHRLTFPQNVPFCLLADTNLMIPPDHMCVLTVAGGHPSEYGISGGPPPHSTQFQVAVKHILHQGFDDGMLSIDCQCGNSDRRIHYPNRYFPRPGILSFVAGAAFGDYARSLLNERVFDMGVRRERAIGYYLDQKLDLLSAELMMDQVPVSDRPSWWVDSDEARIARLSWASAACVPWLSPTGMVQPWVISYWPGVEGRDATKRLKNHYSFLQGAADHYSGAIDLDNSNPFPDYYKTSEQRNWEEVRAITSNDVYTKCGVSETMKNLQEEDVRGWKIQFTIKFRIFGRTHRWSTPPIWIWKRLYDTLARSSDYHQLQYVYDYVLRP